MVPTEVRLKKRYIKGLPSSIKGDVTASKTADLHETIEAANQLIDQVIEDTPKKVVEYKRKWDDHSRNNNNNNHNNPNKRHETARVYTAGLGHYKNECRKLRNQETGGNAGNQEPTKNQGNQANGRGARGRIYAVGKRAAQEDPNIVMGTFLLNNRYATILFDTGADKSFVSTTFSALLDNAPTALDIAYEVELANGNVKRYHTIIICDEKVVRLPYGNEFLTIRVDRNDTGNTSRLNIISCTKAHKYIEKGCHLFLAQVMKNRENKTEERCLSDVPMVQDYQEVFPEDLPGLSPVRQELSNQLSELSEKKVSSGRVLRLGELQYSSLK
ncbi:putative reverse transcriptase domain-containing protein [Tanacetum coccineum]